VNPFVLYLLLLQATATSFAGLASLPVIRHDLVEQRHVLTNEQLDTAIVVSRTTPGPVGVYVVSVGYAAAGMPGAVAGWLAMCTPAFAVIPLVGYMAQRGSHRRIKSMTQAVVVASAALLFASALPIARETLVSPWTAVIAIVSLAAILLTKLDPFWVVVATSLVGLLQAF
jgi:chromate transporter